MNSIDACQKRLLEETTVVEKEIQSHNEQVEALNERLAGLQRAIELFASEQAAILELFQTGTASGDGIHREIATAPATMMQKVAIRPKATAARKQIRRTPQVNRGKTKTGTNARPASQNSVLTRVDMIAAVLRRHPRRTVRELIALLNREYRWQTTESAVTGHLYTRRDKFVRTEPDRATNRPVTWSSK